MNKRSPLMVLVLTVVTLGLYELYWLYITRKELSAKLQGQVKSWPVSILFAPIAIIVLMTVGYVIMSQAGAQDSSISNSLYFLVGALAVIALIVIPFVWFYKFTKLVSATTPQASNSLYLIWLLLTIFGVGLIWPMIVQAHLNSASAQQPQQNPIATPPAPPTPTMQPVAPATPPTTDTTNPTNP